MTRRTVEHKGTAGRKLLAWLAVAALIYWVGRDPAGAAIVVRHIGEGIATSVHAAAQHASKR